MQDETRDLAFSPRPMEASTVIAGVITDQNYPATGNETDLAEFLEELPEGVGVESARLSADEQLSIPKANGTEVSDPAPCRVMVQDGVPGLWRYPHAAARTMLLKMHFVECPQIYPRVGHQLVEFFL